MMSETTTTREVSVTLREDEARAVHAYLRRLPIVGSDPALFRLFQTLDRAIKEWTPGEPPKRGLFRR